MHLSQDTLPPALPGPAVFVFKVPQTAKVIRRRGLIRQTGLVNDQTRDSCVEGRWLMNYTMGAPSTENVTFWVFTISKSTHLGRGGGGGGRVNYYIREDTKAECINMHYLLLSTLDTFS